MRHVLSLLVAGRRCLASTLAFLALAAIGAASLLQAQSLTVAPSGRATTEVVLAPSEKSETAKPLIVRIDYGQPHLRGRELHTGDLVPYDQPWRLGANAASKLQSDVDLVIGGAAVPRGTYVLRALPGRAAWKLVIEKDAGQSPDPAPDAKPPDVVATAELKHTRLQMPLESFTIWLIPSTAAGPARGELRLAWGTAMLSTEWTTK